MIKAYASRTGTRRNLDALAAAGWGLLISAYGVHRYNGAWSAFTSGKPWEPARFEQLLGQFGASSAQTIAPDIVGGGLASLELSLLWLPRLLELGRPVLIPAQDGMEPAHLRPLLGPAVGIAVGGSTDWKWRTLGAWCDLGREAGCRVHVLRANSARMIAWAASAGATSFDGSGPSKYVIEVNRLDTERRLQVQSMTVQDFIDALEPIPGWPSNFDASGHGRVDGIPGPPHANEAVLVTALSKAMAGLDKPPAGILREAKRKTLFLQEPNAWRQ